MRITFKFSFQQLKAKETDRKISTDSKTNKRDENFIKGSFSKENRETSYRSNNGTIANLQKNLTNYENKSEDSEKGSIESDISVSRLRKELDLPFRATSYSVKSSKQQNDPFGLGPVPRSSSTGDADSEGSNSSSNIDKNRSKTISAKGGSPKIFRKPPPKPPRFMMPPATDPSLMSDSESHGTPERFPTVSNLPNPDYEGKKESTKNPNPDYIGPVESTINPRPDYDGSKESLLNPSRDYDVNDKENESGNDMTDSGMRTARAKVFSFNLFLFRM